MNLDHNKNSKLRRIGTPSLFKTFQNAYTFEGSLQVILLVCMRRNKWPSLSDGNEA